jgi:histidyl-tRNA synthetase
MNVFKFVVISALEKLSITNARFDQTLMRGMDYYTGIVFEVFDKNPENRRSVFGGGRYDDLLSLFGGTLAVDYRRENDAVGKI